MDSGALIHQQEQIYVLNVNVHLGRRQALITKEQSMTIFWINL
jgi:hypothetical protein